MPEQEPQLYFSAKDLNKGPQTMWAEFKNRNIRLFGGAFSSEEARTLTSLIEKLGVQGPLCVDFEPFEIYFGAVAATFRDEVDPKITEEDYNLVMTEKAKLIPSLMLHGKDGVPRIVVNTDHKNFRSNLLDMLLHHKSNCIGWGKVNHECHKECLEKNFPASYSILDNSVLHYIFETVARTLGRALAVEQGFSDWVAEDIRYEFNKFGYGAGLPEGATVVVPQLGIRIASPNDKQLTSHTEFMWLVNSLAGIMAPKNFTLPKDLESELGKKIKAETARLTPQVYKVIAPVREAISSLQIPPQKENITQIYEKILGLWFDCTPWKIHDPRWIAMNGFWVKGPHEFMR